MKQIPQNPQWGSVGNEDNPSIELLFHFANRSDGEIILEEFFAKPWNIPPEQFLHIGVIVQAINDQDIAWFMRDDPSIISFQDCCDIFGYDIQAARKAILKRFKRPTVNWKHHLYDGRIKQAKGIKFTHAYAQCKNRYCAECDFRRTYSEKNPNANYQAGQWKMPAKVKAKKKRSTLYKAKYVGRQQQ